MLPFIEKQDAYRGIDLSRHYEDQPSGKWRFVPRVFLCPSDRATSTEKNYYACNYVGISGGGNTGDENGIIVPPDKGAITPAAVIDGLSNTLVITESGSFFRYSDGSESPNRKHATFRTEAQYRLPSEIENFAAECFSDSELSVAPFSIGSEWMEESIGVTRIICIFPKQPRNCNNGGSYVGALFAPNSTHAGGVYCGFGDGSVRMVSEDISEIVWQGVGSRDNGEIISGL